MLSEEFRERLAMKIAWMLPRRIAYWCYIRVAVYNEDGNPADQTVDQPLMRWNA